MEMEFRIVSRVLIGYLLAITPLFAVSTVKFGIRATLWGLAIFHLSCFIAVLAMWWQEERQWSRVGWNSYPGSITIPQAPDAGRKSNQ